MNTELALKSTETHADFTAAHLALLQEFHDKAVAILRKDDPKMSELNAALTMLIKVEKQPYYILHRRPPGQTRTHSCIIPFNPLEPDNALLSTESGNPSTPSTPPKNSSPTPPATKLNANHASPNASQPVEAPEPGSPKGCQTEGDDCFKIPA